MSNYYGRLKKLWDDLVNYKQIQVTNDEKVISILTKRHEDEKLFQFLMGMENNFGTIDPAS